MEGETRCGVKFGCGNRERILRFNRQKTGQGICAECRLENGRLHLEWSFCLGWEDHREKLPAEKDGEVMVAREAQGRIYLRLKDEAGILVLECVYPLWEEEPLQCILQQFQLWNGVETPYTYQLEAFLMDERGKCLDSICRPFPLWMPEYRHLPDAHQEEFCLNDVKFESRAVRYGGAEEGYWAEDLRLMLDMGANCICWEGAENPPLSFLSTCVRLGFLVCNHEGKIFCGCEEISEPLFVDKGKKTGGEGLQPKAMDWKGRGFPEFAQLVSREYSQTGQTYERLTASYYLYKAKWSRHPFVYIVPESIRKLESGNYAVTCYSNCNRVALYSDGRLFEFKKGEAEFEFWEVPAKSPCIMLSAEGEECSANYAIPKCAVSQNFHNFFTN